MDDKLEVGIKEGYTQGHRVIQEIPDVRQSDGPATLAEWGRERVFFNHGLWFSRGGLDKDPLLDICPQIGADLIPLIFDRPVFTGIQVEGYKYLPWKFGPHGIAYPLNHFLFSVHETHWQVLGNELRCFAWLDHERQQLARAVYQEIEIIDQLAMAKNTRMPDPLPLVKVVAFGVDGNKVNLVFSPDTSHPGAVARVISLPPREETIALAGAYLAGHDKPFRAIQPEDPFEGIKGIVPPTH